MSSSWSLLETAPNLLERFSQSLNSVQDLTQTLEQRGLISGGDIVDHAQIHSQVDAVTDVRALFKRITNRDEDSYCSFKRILIENGEYDALEVLSSVCPQRDHRSQPQDETPEPLPQVSGVHQTQPRDRIELPSSLQQVRPGDSPPDSNRSTTAKAGGSSQEEEVDAKPVMGAASTSTADSLPSMVTVTRAETMTVGPRIYKLTDSPRGLCVIFNNAHFPNLRDKDRPGSELDVQRMKMLFEEFKFMVYVHSDLPSHLMDSLLNTYAEGTVLDGHQAFVLILMSHGELNHIYGNDYSQLKLQNIFEKFNNSNCPALRERPKIFFIQACRGDQPDNGAVGRNPIAECFVDDGVQSDAGMFVATRMSGAGDREDQRDRRISCWSDMYIAYAVVEGYESLRDARSGSWFMKAVFDVMARNAHQDDLDTLMENVSQRVLEKVRGDGQRQCPEVKKIGWRKKLFFNPGLWE